MGALEIVASQFTRRPGLSRTSCYVIQNEASLLAELQCGSLCLMFIFWIYIYIHMVFFCLMWWHFRWADFLVWLALGFEVHFQATLLEMDLLHPFPSPFYQDMEADWEAISSWLCLCLFPGISSQALKAFLSPPSSFTSCRRCHQISTAPLHALKTVGGWIQWYRLVLENEKDVLVMFFAPWCGCLTSIKRWEGNW